MKYLKFIPLFVLGLIVQSCEKSESIRVEKDDSHADSIIEVESIQQVAEANRSFGMELFREEVRSHEKGDNILISPVSIHTALNMALNGAAGSTREEMLDAMYSDHWSVEQLNDEQKDWRKLLFEQSGHPELTEANGMFNDPGRLIVEDKFEQALNAYYHASIHSSNFSDPSTKENINAWVAEHTEGKIDQIIDKIKQNDIAFLINTLYFKGDWARGFDERMTYQGVFHQAGGQTVQVSYVNGDDNFQCYEDEEFWAVDLPFKDSTFSLTFLRPKGNVDFTEYWIEGLNKAFLNEVYDELSKRRVHLHFPKMKLMYKNDLNESLRSQGMELAFEPFKADFSKMGTSPGSGNIYLTRVQHKSVLEIDEQGAEGSAATSVGVGVTSLPPELRFDREFVIILRHIETNTPVFIGRVSDPTKES